MPDSFVIPDPEVTTFWWVGAYAVAQVGGLPPAPVDDQREAALLDVVTRQLRAWPPERRADFLAVLARRFPA